MNLEEYNKQSRKRSQGKSLNTFLASRTLAVEQTKAVEEPDLFSILNDTERAGNIEDAIRKIDNEGELISPLAGLFLSALEQKIVIALAKTLYYSTEDDTSLEKGLPAKDIEAIEKPDGEKIQLHNKVDFQLRKSGEKVKISYGWILFSINDFAREVCGKKNLGGRDVEKVKSALSSLSHKFAILKNGKIESYYNLFSIARIDRNTKTNEELWLLELRPIFTNYIAREENFITYRADVLEQFSGPQKGITLNLFTLLTEVHSYSRSEGNLYSISKARLYARIAQKDSYKKNPKRREEDFREAVNKMLSVGIISSYKETAGASGELMAYFTLNPDYYRPRIASK